MNKLLAAAIPALLLGGCATTRQATAEERAQCQAMAQTMGTQTTHEHGEMKGQGPSGMNLTHQRCQQILSQGK